MVPGGTRITRSHSLPTHLVDVEEAEAVQATFQAELASQHFRQCRCPAQVHILQWRNASRCWI